MTGLSQWVIALRRPELVAVMISMELAFVLEWVGLTVVLIQVGLAAALELHGRVAVRVQL